ncbi:hypothetical protein GCM10023322_25380 [Rugosimonospora acidiphila]|uniref:DUF2750 domain-containing protein n=1 Tax=Rugosimonospora acidiphila TaxID=556531 RepID=A0ABP9RS31_9ACTN
MTTSAAHAAAFRRELPDAGEVWTVVEDGFYIAPHKRDGQRAVPFWSRQSRAEKVVARVPAYAGLAVISIPLEDWLGDLLPWLAEREILVGVNWSGNRATGFDVHPRQVIDWFVPKPPVGLLEGVD